MDTTLKRMVMLYGIGVATLALIGIAYAEAGADCHATWKKVLHPDGSATYTLYCAQNTCPHACEATGLAGFGLTWSTCKCDLIYCNAAIRNINGWSSEEQCLGSCTQPATEYCPDVEDDPWTFDGWQGDDPRFRFSCDCV